jgi:hypothetical protein
MNQGKLIMANVKDSLDTLMLVDGAMACALVDGNSGMVMGKAGAGIDLDIAAAGNTEVVRSKMKTMKALGLKEEIDDILISLVTQYHVIRPLAAVPGVFVYMVLDKARSNLAMARIKVKTVEGALTV